MNKKIYYFEDKNGTILSSDGTRRFRVLTGKQAYAHLNTDECKGKRFYKFFDENGDEINIELPQEHVKEYRKQERHEQYVSETQNESGVVIVSIDEIIDKKSGEAIRLEEVIADQDVDVVAEVMHEMDLETLRKAIQTLDPEEIELLNYLYLSKTPVSERTMSQKTGIPQKTINNRRKSILQKLKKFF